MAIVTAQIGSAGDGQLTASLTYGDVTGNVSSLSYTMLSGSGQLKWGAETFTLALGTHTVVPAAVRTLAQRNFGFNWGTS